MKISLYGHTFGAVLVSIITLRCFWFDVDAHTHSSCEFAPRARPQLCGIAVKD